MSKYGVFSGLYFPAFTPYLSLLSPNVGKYGPKKTTYWETFHALYHKKEGEKAVFSCSKFVWLICLKLTVDTRTKRLTKRLTVVLVGVSCIVFEHINASSKNEKLTSRRNKFFNSLDGA